MLVQERGIWGPYNESRLTKWNLDMTEGPCRMRKKFVRNPMFYLQYPYQKKRHSSSIGKHICLESNLVNFEIPEGLITVLGSF